MKFRDFVQEGRSTVTDTINDYANQMRREIFKSAGFGDVAFVQFKADEEEKAQEALDKIQKAVHQYAKKNKLKKSSDGGYMALGNTTRIQGRTWTTSYNGKGIRVGI